MLAEGSLEFIHADVLFGHVRFDNHAVEYQQTGLSLYKFSETARLLNN